jgi:hypothetical protein
MAQDDSMKFSHRVFPPCLPRMNEDHTATKLVGRIQIRVPSGRTVKLVVAAGGNWGVRHINMIKKLGWNTG